MTEIKIFVDVDESSSGKLIICKENADKLRVRNNDRIEIVNEDNKQTTTAVVEISEAILDFAGQFSKDVLDAIQFNGVELTVRAIGSGAAKVATKAKKFYVANFEMHTRGIQVPEAVLILEKKILFIKFLSIIITKAIPDSQPFTAHYKAWAQNNPDDKRYYLKALADFIFLLNSRKVAHSDLLGNILGR